MTIAVVAADGTAPRATRSALLGVAAQRRGVSSSCGWPRGVGRPGRRFVQRVERLLNGPPPAPPRYRIVALSAVVAALLAGVAGSTIAGPRVMVFGGNWENWDRISPSPMVVSHPRASELAAPAASLTSVSPATSVSGLVVGERKRRCRRPIARWRVGPSRRPRRVRPARARSRNRKRPCGPSRREARR